MLLLQLLIKCCYSSQEFKSLIRKKPAAPFIEKRVGGSKLKALREKIFISSKAITRCSDIRTPGCQEIIEVARLTPVRPEQEESFSLRYAQRILAKGLSPLEVLRAFDALPLVFCDGF